MWAGFKVGIASAPAGFSASLRHRRHGILWVLRPMNRTGTVSRAVAAGGVLALLAIMMVQLAGTAGQNSITWDEDDHIYAGYMSWRHSDFGLNPEHPPLVKLVAALPLLPMPLRVPALQGRFFKHEAFLGGKDFLFKNDADAMFVSGAYGRPRVHAAGCPARFSGGR